MIDSTSIRTCAIMVAATWMLGCGGAAEPPPPTPVVQSRRAEAVPAADRLYQDDRSEMDSVRVVITSSEELRRWWNRVTASVGEPRPSLPDVSFQTHMVLLVSAGRSDAGDRIQIDSVGFEIQPSPAGGSRTVSFAVVRTIPDCNPFPGVSYPTEMVRMPRANPDIDWIEITEEC